MRDECEHGSLRRSCRVCELEAECQEQARLLGMSAERELALRAEIAEATKDAERYRWLRATTNWASSSTGERINVRDQPELWDDAIDAAIAASKEK